MSDWEALYGLLTVRPLSTNLPEPERAASFSARWRDTVRLLGREVHHLEPNVAVMEAGFTGGQLRIDGFPKATARPWTEGVILTLVGTPHGDLRYPCSTFTDWQDNVRAIALALEALRKVDRYGVTKRGEQYAGWKQLTSGRDEFEQMRRGEALALQHGGIAKALIATHPDTGGDRADFDAVMTYKRIEEAP
jgi:hypothetical protein